MICAFGTSKRHEKWIRFGARFKGLDKLLLQGVNSFGGKRILIRTATNLVH